MWQSQIWAIVCSDVDEVSQPQESVSLQQSLRVIPNKGYVTARKRRSRPVLYHCILPPTKAMWQLAGQATGEERGNRRGWQSFVG